MVALLYDQDLKEITKKIVKNGAFEIPAHVVKDRIYTVTIKYTNGRIVTITKTGLKGIRDTLTKSIRIYAEPDAKYNLSLSADTSDISITTKSLPTQKLLELRKIRNDENDLSKVEESRLNRLSDGFMAAGDMDKYRLYGDSALDIRLGIKGRLTKKYKAFMRTNLNSPITPYLISQAIDLPQSKAFYESILSKLDPGLKKNPFTVLAKKRLAALKFIEVGDDFGLPIGEDTKGNPFKIKYGSMFTLVEFWASWCAPCRAKNGQWMDIYKKYKSDKFEILGISFDTNRDRWINAIKQDQITWQQVSDLTNIEESPYSVRYNVKELPLNFLLDAKGKIMQKDITPEQLRSLLAKQL